MLLKTLHKMWMRSTTKSFNVEWELGAKWNHNLQSEQAFPCHVVKTILDGHQMRVNNY